MNRLTITFLITLLVSLSFTSLNASESSNRCNIFFKIKFCSYIGTYENPSSDVWDDIGEILTDKGYTITTERNNSNFIFMHYTSETSSFGFASNEASWDIKTSDSDLSIYEGPLFESKGQFIVKSVDKLIIEATKALLSCSELRNM